MLLTDWLKALEPSSVYTEDIFHRLIRFNISYDNETGLLTSRILAEVYPTFGRLAAADRLTERQVINLCHSMNLAPATGMKAGHDYLVFGFGVISSVWRLLHPIIESGPPSELHETPDDKAAADLRALRRYGY